MDSPADMDVVSISGGRAPAIDPTSGLPWYTVRNAKPDKTPGADWDPFVDAQKAAQDPNTKAVTAAAATAGSQLHICVSGLDKHLYHAIRDQAVKVTWTHFVDVTKETNSTATVAGQAVATIGGDLHVCIFNEDGKLFHTIRHQVPSPFTYPGRWDKMIDVGAVTDPRMSKIGGVWVTGIGGDLQVWAIDAQHQLWYTIRHADPAPPKGSGWWDPFALSSPGIGTVVGVGLAPWGAQLLLVALSGDGKMHLTRHYADTKWSEFTDISGPDKGLGQVVQIAVATGLGNLWVCAITANGSAQLNALNLQTGEWGSFTDVKGAAGDVGKITAGGMAADGDQLHFVAIAPGKT